MASDAPKWPLYGSELENNLGGYEATVSDAMISALPLLPQTFFVGIALVILDFGVAFNK